MKKCASCTKDLPDAALHCVFCGAKQPPAPAVQQSMAKTAFGLPAAVPQPPPMAPQQQLGFQATQIQQPLPAQPYQPPRSHPASAPPPMMAPPQQPVLNPSSVPVNPGFVPASAANAKTMFVPAPDAAPAAGSHSPMPMPTPASQLATLVPGNQYAPAPIPASAPPPQPQFPQVNFQVRPMPPPMAIPQAMNQPYHSSATGITRSGRVLDPYRRSLPMMMFLWGFALIAVFATPLTTTPMAFHWTTVLEGAGLARLIPLTFAAVGLLGVLLAVIPMPSFVRGLLAALLGLAGLAMPMVVAGAAPPWQALVPMVGTLVIIVGLVLRSQYRDSWLARLLVTFGALAMLVPYLLPQNSVIPLVEIFKSLIEAPGSAKVYPALAVVQVIIIVMSLLAWLPAPITGGAMLWAWLLILWALIVHVVNLLLAGGVADQLTAAPNPTILGWVAGGAADKGPIVLGAAYLVFVGYGLAAFLGKQLE